MKTTCKVIASFLARDGAIKKVGETYTTSGKSAISLELKGCVRVIGSESVKPEPDSKLQIGDGGSPEAFTQIKPIETFIETGPELVKPEPKLKTVVRKRKRGKPKKNVK